MNLDCEVPPLGKSAAQISMKSISMLCSRNVTTAGDFNQHPFHAFVLDSNRRALPQEGPRL